MCKLCYIIVVCVHDVKFLLIYIEGLVEALNIDYIICCVSRLEINAVSVENFNCFLLIYVNIKYNNHTMCNTFHCVGPVLDIHIFVFKFHAQEFRCNTLSRPF